MRRFWLVLSLILVCFALSTTWISSVSAQEAQATGETTYVVVRGDTLYALSIRFHTTVAAIGARNSIANVNLIYVGQVLIIPASGTTPPPAPTATTPPGQPTATPAPGGTVTYVVRWGDTLGRIAGQYGTTVTAIAQLNHIVNPNLIYVGQVLTISGTPPAPTPTTQPGQPTQPVPTSPPISGSFELGGQTLNGNYSVMHTAAMSWAKIQIRWQRGQPVSIVDGAVNGARGNGFKVLLSIVGTPSDMGSDLTSYYQDFANFLGSVAGTYHPEAIEVWNEQNIDREWPAGKISPSGYTDLLRRSYQAIKAASSSTMVISGAPSPTGYFGGGCTGAGCDDKPFLQQMAYAGAGSYADCIGIHYNEGVLSPDATSGDPRGNPNHYTRYYSTMVNTYRAIFPSKPLCFTELGYLTPEGLGPLPASFSWAANTTVSQQAAWLARAVTLSRQRGYIRLLIVWNVDATIYGDDPQAGYAIVRNGVCVAACGTLSAAMQ